jgi:hypothetical protein
MAYQRRSGAKVRVASTGTSPELRDVIPIARAQGPGRPREVVMSLGPDSTTDLPLPQSPRPGDLLRIYVELQVTTDYETKNPGSMGTPYTYAPRIQAVLLLAADRDATAHEEGRAHSIVKTDVIECTHKHHHEVVTIAKGEYRVPETGIPWPGSVFVNVALSAAHPDAAQRDVLLIGENEPTPVVDQDTGGIRVIRLRPGDQPEVAAVRETRRRTAGVPVAKRSTVVVSKRLENLVKGEQLFVRGRLITDARHTGYPTRISTELLLADQAGDTDPGAESKRVASWNGHISKPNGFNCLPGEGPRRSEKFGVLEVREDAKELCVNLVATSSRPFQMPHETADDLPVEEGSFIEVTRYPPQLRG